MRCLLLTAAALLLVAGVAMATSVSQETAVAVAEPANAQGAINALKELADLYKTVAEIFEKVPGGQVASLLVSTLSFIGALAGFFGNSESTEMQYMRQQFTLLHGRLDSIDLRLGEIKRLIEWTTTKKKYSEYERNIRNNAELFDTYLKTRNAGDKKIRQDAFVRAFRPREQDAKLLYDGIMHTGSLSDNIVDSCRKFTKDHQSQVIRLLMHLVHTVTRGAEMQVAYIRLTQGQRAAELSRGDWNRYIRLMTNRVAGADTDIKRKWENQMKSDVVDKIRDFQRDSNTNFARKMYNFLADKFYWRRWFVLNYKDVSGYEHHTFSICGGASHLRTHGGRNVLVASADPKTSRFSKSRGDTILRAANVQVKRRYSQDYVNAINSIVGSNYCRDAAARIAVCWGCDVHGVHAGGRLSYLRATPTLDARNRPCRNCYMHTYLFG